METLTFEFHGIAVHMTEFSPYRIVIPAGHVPTGFTLSPTITPAALAPLDGVTFTVGSGQPLSVDIDVPHLSQLYPGMIVNPDVVSGQQPPAVAYFDFIGGVVSMSTYEDALYAQVDVEVAGQEAFIQVQRWNQPGTTAIAVPLSHPIVIKNVPSPEGNTFNAAEYMSNFVIASNFPTGSTLNQVEANIRHTLEPPAPAGHLPMHDTTPSCSNSQWP